MRSSILVGLTAGFATGSLLFASLLLGFGTGLWWPATARAHGHAQLFGWAGLMVIGVGLRFLPRLASKPEPNAAQVRRGFWFLLFGLVVRLGSRPATAIAEPETVARVAEIAWVIGAAGEFIGAVLVVAALAKAITTGGTLPTNPAIRSLVPFFGISFLSLLAVSGITPVLGLLRLTNGELLIDRTSSDGLILVMFYGFLIPASVAMSARLFPLYVRTRPAKLQLLRAGLILLAAGVVLRLVTDGDGKLPIGRLLILASTASFAASLGIFGPRRELPRRPMRLWRDVTGLHALSAYAWLLCAGAVQVLGAAWQDVERHLLGAGFVTMLIFGMGAHLIPGFGRRTIRGGLYLWATLLLGNLAVAIRVIPAIPDLHLPVQIERSAGAAAGVAGLMALTFFAINVGVMFPRNAGPDDDTSSRT
ncbi:MAG: hypothetical protein R3A46_17725 [Thermomicrobiales bacterium]